MRPTLGRHGRCSFKTKGRCWRQSEQAVYASVVSKALDALPYLLVACDVDDGGETRVDDGVGDLHFSNGSGTVQSNLGTERLVSLSYTLLTRVSLLLSPTPLNRIHPLNAAPPTRLSRLPNMDSAKAASASSSSSPARENAVNVPETERFTGEPQAPYDYHSLDGRDPVICIDNGGYY